MIPFDKLIVRFKNLKVRGSACRLRRPEPESLEEIKAQLGIDVPPDFVKFAIACPNTGILVGLGEDVDDPLHIIALNSDLRRDDEPTRSPLPPDLIAFTPLQDGNVVCWDSTQQSANGDYPVVQVNLLKKPAVVKAIYPSFRDYMQHRLQSRRAHSS